MKPNERSEPLPLLWEEVRARIRLLKHQLAAHDSNIALLQAFSTGRMSLKGRGYTRAAENYTPSAEDKKRLPRTLANLDRQCAILLREINLLKKEYDL